MAIITYTQDAVLGAYQQWLMQQGAQACLERITRPQGPASCADVAGAVVAQAGSQIRYTVLTTLTSASVFFSGQFQTESGMWQNVNETVIGTSAGGVDQVTRPAVAGCYRTMVASVGSATVAGSEVYVLAELGRTNNGVFQPYAILTSGYVRTNEPIDMTPSPGTRNPPSSGGGGCCIGAMYTDFGSGAASISMTITVPSGAQTRIVAAECNLVSSAAAGNRLAFFELDTFGGAIAFIDYAPAVQAPGTNIQYHWRTGGQRYESTQVNEMLSTLPEDLWFNEDITVSFSQDNLDVGDNWGSASVTYIQQGP